MMASVVSGTHGESISKTFSHLKQKMVDLTREIRKTDERTKEFKLASKEQFARERAAVDQQHGIRDRMEALDRNIDKVETKIEWMKERLFVAVRRNEENLKMVESLEGNRIVVPSFDERMEDVTERMAMIAENIANTNRKIDVMKTKVEAAEKRYLKARMKKDHLEEIKRSIEQTRHIESCNYKHKTDDEYLEEIKELKYRLSEAVRRFQVKEARQAELERKETEIDANIQHTKNKTLSVQQAIREMQGSK